MRCWFEIGNRHNIQAAVNRHREFVNQWIKGPKDVSPKPSMITPE
jgi:hypothetical protein